MSVTRTFTVTVVSTGSGNKYFIDGVQTPTLELVEGGTFRFDVSDSSMGSHPFKFSTTSGGTHSGGSEYTTGVTTSGTTGQSGAYVQIEVADSAPTLYYYCQYHSGMGGQANTPTTDFWGAGNWSAGLWGITEAFTSGWGVDAWNTGGSWGQVNDEITTLTGQSITSSVGDVIASSEQGWGRDQWGKEPWGESFSPVVAVDGVSITSSVGSLSAFNEQGWGRDTWNFESWGFSGLTVEVTAPDAITSNLGANGWSNATYGENGWGMFTLNPADVVGLTGVSSTSGVGSTTITFSPTVTLSGSTTTSSVGSISIDDMAVGLTGQVATLSVGTLAFDLTSIVVPTGQEATTSVGDLIAGIVEFVPITGVSTTASVGSITLDQMTVSFDGVSATFNVGTLVPADVMGLTGVSATASVAAFGTASGFGIQAYQDVDTGSNTTYTDAA